MEPRGGPGLRFGAAAAHGSEAGGLSAGDADELGWLLVAAVCAVAGVAAVGFVVYSAPSLLAEVALDAALVSTAYRRLGRHEAGYWAVAVLRRTWRPALVLAGFLAMAGLALERAAPQARSIGGVVRALAR